MKAYYRTNAYETLQKAPADTMTQADDRQAQDQVSTPDQTQG